MTYGVRERESYNRLMYALEDGGRERQGRREREGGRGRMKEKWGSCTSVSFSLVRW